MIPLLALKALPWRLIGALTVVALFAGVLWHDHRMTKKLNAKSHELVQAHADLAAERINTEKANAAANHLVVSLENLKAARSDTPVRTVRMCNGAASVRAGAAAGGADAAGDARHAQEARRDTADGRLPGFDYDRWSEDGPDAGPALYALSDEKDEQLARCAVLQEWIRNR
jgi:hypothetical protein